MNGEKRITSPRRHKQLARLEASACAAFEWHSAKQPPKPNVKSYMTSLILLCCHRPRRLDPECLARTLLPIVKEFCLKRVFNTCQKFTKLAFFEFSAIFPACFGILILSNMRCLSICLMFHSIKCTYTMDTWKQNDGIVPLAERGGWQDARPIIHVFLQSSQMQDAHPVIPLFSQSSQFTSQCDALTEQGWPHLVLKDNNQPNILEDHINPVASHRDEWFTIRDPSS